MASSEKFFDPKVLARLGRLELRARAVVEGMISGLHRSPYHGQSVEFVDHREYVPGDDPRHIDWKVFGRADRIVIKRYEDDTNLRGHILLDSSESMRFAYGDRLSKYEYGGTLAATVAYLFQRQHDAAGLTLFDAAVRARVPPGTGQNTLRQIAEVMEQARPEKKTGLAAVLRQLAEETPRRGIAVIISDLFAPLEEITAGLRELIIHRQEVIVFHVLDETELTFPFEGNTLFKGLEEYPELLVEPRALRQAYLEAVGKFLAAVKDACARLGIDYHLSHTGEPLERAVIAVAAARARARKRSRNAPPQGGKEG